MKFPNNSFDGNGIVVYQRGKLLESNPAVVPVKLADRA